MLFHSRVSLRPRAAPSWFDCPCMEALAAAHRRPHTHWSASRSPDRGSQPGRRNGQTFRPLSPKRHSPRPYLVPLSRWRPAGGTPSFRPAKTSAPSFLPTHLFGGRITAMHELTSLPLSFPSFCLYHTSFVVLPTSPCTASIVVCFFQLVCPSNSPPLFLPGISMINLRSEPYL
jgi:hypothetical protein